jgi:hypothetical protein
MVGNGAIGEDGGFVIGAGVRAGQKGQGDSRRQDGGGFEESWFHGFVYYV